MMAQLLSVQPLQRPTLGPACFVLLQFGLRPFVLLSSGFAAVSIDLWISQFAGSLLRAGLSGQQSHAHETPFSFNRALTRRFLHTARRDWSERLTQTCLHGAPLARMWLAGHVLLLTPLNWTAVFASTAFPLAGGAALAVPLWAARNWRKYLCAGLSVLAPAARLVPHLLQPGVGDWSARLRVQIAFTLSDPAVLTHPRLDRKDG